MTTPTVPEKPRKKGIHRWIRLGFLLWAVVSTSWLVNSMRTQGVDDALIQSSDSVSVVDAETRLEFLPASSDSGAGLIFLCGAGVSAEAYAPMLRPIADAGYPVFIIRLPYRIAPLDTHKEEAIARARRVIADHQEIKQWVLAGHSLGAALAARFAGSDQGLISALVLVGTTHPKEQNLSFLQLPVTKVYATSDGVAPADEVLSNRRLLPEGTKWVPIEGGNHSQFGHYGHQLFDGDATISREAQQAIARSEILELLTGFAK